MKYLKTYNRIVESYINPDTIEINRDWNNIDKNHEFKNKCWFLIKKYGEDIKINTLNIKRFTLNIKGFELSDKTLKINNTSSLCRFKIEPSKNYNLEINFLKKYNLIELLLYNIDFENEYVFLANDNADISLLWKIREYILDPDLDIIIQAKQMNIF